MFQSLKFAQNDNYLIASRQDKLYLYNVENKLDPIEY